MDVWDAIILGVIEGITEFLPISSTGHLILANRLLGNPDTPFVKSFEIAIQAGAILAVAMLYARTLLLDRGLLLKIGAAFLPTALIGYFLYPWIKGYLLGSSAVVAWALLLGGIFLIAFERFHSSEKATRELEEITYSQAVLIGIAQSFAVVPGVSRAAATILGGLAIGIQRTAIVEFSFLLAIPTMFAATGLDLIQAAPAFTKEEGMVLAVGVGISFLSAWAAVRFLLNYIRRRDFTAFGIYRIVIALAWFAWM